MEKIARWLGSVMQKKDGSAFMSGIDRLRARGGEGEGFGKGSRVVECVDVGGDVMSCTRVYDRKSVFAKCWRVEVKADVISGSHEQAAFFFLLSSNQDSTVERAVGSSGCTSSGSGGRGTSRESSRFVAHAVVAKSTTPPASLRPLLVRHPGGFLERLVGGELVSTGRGGRGGPSEVEGVLVGLVLRSFPVSEGLGGYGLEVELVGLELVDGVEDDFETGSVVDGLLHEGDMDGRLDLVVKSLESGEGSLHGGEVYRLSDGPLEMANRAILFFFVHSANSLGSLGEGRGSSPETTSDRSIASKASSILTLQ